MNILITGASGYLGARLARHLKKTHPDCNLLLASRSGRCHWIDGLGEQISLELGGASEIRLPQSLDAIVHLAAINEVDCADVSKALRVNVEGTWNLIDAAVTAGVKHFVYASTIHVYGPLEGTLSESSLVHSRHAYGFTHHMGEELFEYATSKYPMSATCLRFSNIIGAPANPRVNRWMLLVNDLCRQAVQTKRLVLKSPESRRDFIAMTDACAAFEKAVFGYKTRDKFEVFNISRGETIRVRDMAELIADQASRILGSKIEIQIDDNGSAPTGQNVLIDNSRAKKWGWNATGDLKAEIQQTLQLCADGDRT